MYKNALLSKESAQKAAGLDSSGENQHECICNMCGDDLSKRAQDIADLKFQAFKTEFEKSQENVKMQNLENGQSGAVVNNTEVSNVQFQSQIKDLKKSHDSQVQALNDDIQSQKMLSVYLINEIEKYKTQ